MSTLLILAVVLALLFAVAFITKRRFGVLGLALCAGALLSGTWTSSLTPLIEQQGITLISPPLSAVVALVLTLMPALLLLFSGPAYAKLPGRVIGSLLFALMAFVFLLEPLRVALVFDNTTMRLYEDIKQFSSNVIIIGIGVALVDILLTRTPKSGKRKSDH